MTKITQLIQPIVYTGLSLDLPTAGFVSYIDYISKASPNGKGFVNYVPNSTYPAFTTLEPGIAYTIYSNRIGYSIPDITTVLALISPDNRRWSLSVDNNGDLSTDYA